MACNLNRTEAKELIKNSKTCVLSNDFLRRRKRKNEEIGDLHWVRQKFLG